MTNFLRRIILLFIFSFLCISHFYIYGQNNSGSGILFKTAKEPKEEAFTFFMPKGWQVDGGIIRVNAALAGGPLNAMEAKCNLRVKSDSKESVSFRILPDIVYAHVGVGGGFFPIGSNYQGAIVRPIVDASTLLQSIFKELRPNANYIKILKITHLPGEKKSLDKGLAYTNTLLAQIGLQSLAFQSDAAGALYEYSEDGKVYREVLLTGLIDMPAALTWKNTRTLTFRTRIDQFEQYRPVMDIIRFSIRFNPKWILKEAGGQKERAEIVRKVYEETRRIDHEILKKTTINHDEIFNDNFLVLTEQEEYVNPHTGEVEMDTDAYKYRWTSSGGDYYYTNKEDENPNHFLQRTDYLPTPIRRRRNE